MKLYSLYGYFATKFSTKDDTIIRKRLMAFPETQLLDLANTTLVIPNDYAGMKVVQFHHIDGFTHSTAVDTLLTPNYHTMPITIQHHHEYVLDELEHPELPLLAVRVGQGFGAAIDYEFYPLERVYYRQTEETKPRAVTDDTWWLETDSESDDGETGFEAAVGSLLTKHAGKEDLSKTNAKRPKNFGVLLTTKAPAGSGIGSPRSHLQFV